MKNFRLTALRKSNRAFRTRPEDSPTTFSKCCICRMLIFSCLIVLQHGCAAKVVGDPDRPIVIKAHVIVDVRGLKDTATDIEDYVSGGKSESELPVK